MSRPTLAVAALTLALAASGCGGDDENDKGAGTSTTRTEVRTTATAPKERDAARQEAADKKQQERELEDQEKEDREFDKSFKESGFDRLVTALPVREPPLYVEQYITGDGHKVYTAVDRKRFCGMSAGARQRAVAAFYRAANGSFRRGGVNDFEQVVTPLSDSIDKLPALATARGDKVVLTRLGRRC